MARAHLQLRQNTPQRNLRRALRRTQLHGRGRRQLFNIAITQGISLHLHRRGRFQHGRGQTGPVPHSHGRTLQPRRGVRHIVPVRLYRPERHGLRRELATQNIPLRDRGGVEIVDRTELARADETSQDFRGAAVS